jgi:hypothetical protein
MAGTANKDCSFYRSSSRHQKSKEYSVRTAAEYMEKAAEFEQMAGATQDPVLQARFSSIAGCYRLLAREREWLIEIGAMENQPAARRPRRGTMGLLRR